MSARRRRALVWAVWATVAIVSAALAGPAAAGPAYPNVIFLHHSTGANLIAQGGVRARLTAMGFRFWDHGYNGDGLTKPDGNPANYNYRIPDDNTDPDGYARIFSQTLYTTPLHPSAPANAFSGLMRHQVIVFKSCFPTSAIADAARLTQYKTWYQTVRNRAKLYPNRIFIAFTPPPLNPLATNRDEARRARAFADWLKSPAYLSGAPNLFAFDFFSLLAEPNASSTQYSMLRARYRPTGDDSHPNALANRTIGPVFATFVRNVSGVYAARCGAAPAVPAVLAPANGARTASTQVLLDWTDRACTAYYEVRVRRGSGTGPLMVGEITAGSAMRTPPLKAGYSYYWRVAACNHRGCSAYTPERRFSIY